MQRATFQAEIACCFSIAVMQGRRHITMREGNPFLYTLYQRFLWLFLHYQQRTVNQGWIQIFFKETPIHSIFQDVSFELASSTLAELSEHIFPIWFHGAIHMLQDQFTM